MSLISNGTNPAFSTFLNQPVENPEVPPNDARLQFCKQLLQDSFMLISETKSIKDRMNRAVKYISLFIEDTMKTTARITQAVEDGLNREINGESIQGLEIYAREKGSTIKELMLRVDKCRTLLDGIAWRYKTQGTLFQVDYQPQREQQLLQSYQPIKVIGKIGNSIAIFNGNEKTTDIIEIDQHETLVTVKTFPHKVSLFTFHGERLIVDNQVYQKQGGTYEFIQSLGNLKKPTTGCSLTKDLVAFGSISLENLQIWRWDANCYQKLYNSPAKVPYLKITLMKKAQFTDDSYLIYSVISKNQLYRIKLDSSTDTQKLLQEPLLSDKIINYALVNPNSMLILYKKKIVVLNTETKQQVSSVNLSLAGWKQNALIIPRCFDLETFPIIFMCVRVPYDVKIAPCNLSKGTISHEKALNLGIPSTGKQVIAVLDTCMVDENKGRTTVLLYNQERGGMLVESFDYLKSELYQQ
ncbi:hypothetical protein FGO68_gene17614 [Halteria grandinella]|uniref:Uncharacterized protein n=1 Tax=Halteria grandinella TaxID=5974 RepID=A0A8J8NP89_HALGN|nr:hypothetical protein FGO68_gene17614 [Halteria grandinella]